MSKESKGKKNRHASNFSESGKRRKVGKYVLGEVAGRGGFGVVYSAVHSESGERVAIKSVRTSRCSEEDLGTIESEIGLLQELDHEHIVRYIGHKNRKGRLYIIMEFAERGSLLNVVREFRGMKEVLVAKYIDQTLCGLSYLHNQGVIHRDLKAANLLLGSNNQIKLADFGLSVKIHKKDKERDNKLQQVEHSTDESPVGTPYWMAPEIILMNAPTVKCDIWSIGCCVIELLTGHPPYFNLQPLPALYQIVQDESPPLPKKISALCRDFLDSCFHKNPSTRPSAAELRNHPWILQNLGKQKQKENKHNKKRKKSATSNNRNQSIQEEQQQLKILQEPPKKGIKTEEKMEVDELLLTLDEDNLDISDNFDDLFGEEIIEIQKTTSTKNDEDEKEKESIEIKEEEEEEEATALFLNQNLYLNLSILKEELVEEEIYQQKEKAKELKQIVNSSFFNCESKDEFEELKKVGKGLLEEEKVKELFYSFYGGGSLIVEFVEKSLDSGNEDFIEGSLLFLSLFLKENEEWMYRCCIYGMIPLVLKCCSPKWNTSIRVQSSILIHHLITTSSRVGDVFKGCGGVKGIQRLLSGDLTMKIVRENVESLFDLMKQKEQLRNMKRMNFGMTLNQLLNWMIENNENTEKETKKVCILYLNLVQNGGIGEEEEGIEEEELEFLLKNLMNLKEDEQEEQWCLIKCISEYSRRSSCFVPFERVNGISTLIEFIEDKILVNYCNEKEKMYFALMSCIWSLCRMNVDLQKRAAFCEGFIDILKKEAVENGPLCPISVDLLCSFVRHPVACHQLKKYNGVALMLSLLNLQGWQMNVLDAIRVWLTIDRMYVHKELMKHFPELINPFRSMSTLDFNALLEPLHKLMVLSSKITLKMTNENIILNKILNSLKRKTENYKTLTQLRILLHLLKYNKIKEKKRVLEILENVKENHQQSTIINSLVKKIQNALI